MYSFYFIAVIFLAIFCTDTSALIGLGRKPPLKMLTDPDLIYDIYLCSLDVNECVVDKQVDDYNDYKGC